jgi:mycofactocin system glycosyltransferase
VITLTSQGAAVLDAVVRDGAEADALATLAGRLVKAGMAHPRPGPAPATSRSLAVVVPVHDRSDALDRCLASLGPDVEVVVVDDASRDAEAVARVCAVHGARLVRRGTNGGPAAARTDGLSATTSELVAFVDSDCTVEPDWLADILWQFEDPEVGAVAPRVRPADASGARASRAIDRFQRAHSPLDLGPDEGEVGPDRAIRYVPTAALVVRRAAVVATGGFDTALRVGEDVDLVWRLVDAGWRVRYQPEVTVSHDEPRGWVALLARRLRYGTSAGPLAVRHRGRLAPVELRPLPTVAALSALAGRPLAAVAAVSVSAALLDRAVRDLGIPTRKSVSWSVRGVGWSVFGMGRAATMLAAPGLVALATRGRRARGAAFALVVVPPVVEWVRRRPDLDLPRWVVASVADDVAYGTGVWIGCLRAGTFGPLVPALRLRQR